MKGNIRIMACLLLAICIQVCHAKVVDREMEEAEEEKARASWEGLKWLRVETAGHQPLQVPQTTMQVPLPAKKRLAFKKEFPWAVLLSLSAGPDLTGGLITLRWALAACSPGTLRRRRLSSDAGNRGTPLGRAYAGFSVAQYFQGEGNVECPPMSRRQTSKDEDTQCRFIVEIVAQDASLDPANALVMMRVDPPFERSEWVVPVPVPAQRRLPFLHREQCWSIWYAPETKETNTSTSEEGGRRSLNWRVNEKQERRRIRRVRRRSEEPALRWNLWAQPVGLWQAEHCERGSSKAQLLCEESWFAEQQLLQGEPGYVERPPEDDQFGNGAGGPSQCSARYRRSAAAQCQGMLAALRMPLESVYDVLYIQGVYTDNTMRCSARSNIGRRLWLWTGASGDWADSVATNCTEAPLFHALNLPESESGHSSTLHIQSPLLMFAVATGVAFALRW